MRNKKTPTQRATRLKGSEWICSEAKKRTCCRASQSDGLHQEPKAEKKRKNLSEGGGNLHNRWQGKMKFSKGQKRWPASYARFDLLQNGPKRRQRKRGKTERNPQKKKGQGTEINVPH